MLYASRWLPGGLFMETTYRVDASCRATTPCQSISHQPFMSAGPIFDDVIYGYLDLMEDALWHL